MITTKMTYQQPLNRDTLLSLNKPSKESPNVPQKAPPLPPSNAPQRIPPLLKPAQKGQKITLGASSQLRRIKACFGWNSLNSLCDVDVSAFLLGANAKVIGESWFVFYGQEKSQPLGSIDFNKLNPDVCKIVFVLTIHEALYHKLHFGMLKDAYIRILQEDNQTELVSFKMTEYYTNVISMMIGEVYRHNGEWKFHAVGNGVARDLAGLCGLYGVQVCD